MPGFIEPKVSAVTLEIFQSEAKSLSDIILTTPAFPEDEGIFPDQSEDVMPEAVEKL